MINFEIHNLWKWCSHCSAESTKSEFAKRINICQSILRKRFWTVKFALKYFTIILITMNYSDSENSVNDDHETSDDENSEDDR